MIEHLCVIGVGLIGGSLARALREAGHCREVVGCGRRADGLEKAKALGVVDSYTTDPAEAVRGAEMVVLSVPMGAFPAVLGQIAGHLEPDAVITDVGSTKGAAVEAARQGLVDRFRSFVPGHPIAGTERSGVEASFAELFQERRVILTPTAETERAATDKVAAMWKAAGAEVVEMGVEHHDRVLAGTSHLPHVLAFNLVDTLARWEEQEEIFAYAAGGFRDFTRIASSDPVMWRDICLTNRAAILNALADFSTQMADLARAIDAGDGERIEEVFRRAKAARDKFCE